jgi:hypothetical protein
LWCDCLEVFIMAERIRARQVVSTDSQLSPNGSPPHDQARLATAEAPAQDLPDDLPDLHAEDPEPIASPKPAVTIDLDDALGDERALKHDLLEDTPPVIDVRVPKKREYFMVHPTLERVTQVVEYTAPEGIGRAYYLATSQMRRKLEEEDLKTVRLVVCMSLTDRSIFLWPMNEDDEGSENPWNTSSRKHAERAKGYWARRVSHRKGGGKGYGTKFAPPGHPLPEWPEKTMREWLIEAFQEGGRIIDSVDHPVFRALDARL